MQRTEEVTRSLRALFWSVLVAVFGYLLISAFEPLRLNWGDPWSDANVLTALNYSSKYGFWKTSFTDVLDVGPLTSESYHYTHYPPFAEIFYGTIRKIAGGKPLDITVYRLFAIGFAAIGMAAFYRYVRDVWGKGLAHWATMLCATNLLWIQFADAMHQAPILFASGMTALAAIPHQISPAGGGKDGETDSRGPVTSRLALIAGTYVCFLTAYDYYFFLPIASLLTARVLGVPFLSKKMIRLAAIVAASGALAIATKAAFVSGALGWHGFLEDVHFQFMERATTKYSPDYKSGFLIVILTRWTAYFTPLPFVIAIVLFVRGAKAIWRYGLRASLRALLFGDNVLRGDPSTILLLLFAALPFIVVFSELSVEQVLPSQVMIPFYAVGCAAAVVWVQRVVRALGRPQLAYGAFALFVGWQLGHMTRVPKTFLDRDATSKIQEYLRQNDSADFLVTNLMSDGPVQYFFDRHMQMPTEVVAHTPGSYMELSSRTPSGIIHAVYFEDPGTRLIDKSLWYLLPYKSKWAVFGAPYVFRKEALDILAEWDSRVLQGLERSGTEVMRLPGVRVFRLGANVDQRRIENRAKLERSPNTRYIDFGTPESDVHKLSGFRYAERYPGVPGFAWSIGRTLYRTVLTKRGLEYRKNSATTFESRVLLRLDTSEDQKVRLITWGAIADQTLTATLDGKIVLPTHEMGRAQLRQEISFVIPKELIDDPVKELVFTFRDVADYGGGVAFAIMYVDPISKAPTEPTPLESPPGPPN